MASKAPNTHTRALLSLLCVSAAALAGVALLQQGPPLSGGLTLRPTVKESWATVEPDEVEDGATIPSNTNVVFSLPLDMPDIYRETLLGNRGQETRYWGYCFPALTDDPNEPTESNGFPGKLFLSEAERAYRENLREVRLPRYSIFRPPTRLELLSEQQLRTTRGAIRHQIEVYHGAQRCYIMSADPLPIGTDRDNDGVNSQMEKQYGTDPINPDTDGDTAPDGIEIFNLHTDPINPDTDGDGLPDGIEVHSHEHVRQGDTDPLMSDSDHDGLCDGYCRIDRAGQYCTADYAMRCVDTNNLWTGEDKNLNGIVDKEVRGSQGAIVTAGETDPTQWSTGNNVSDSTKYYKCLLQGKSNYSFSGTGTVACY